MKPMQPDSSLVLSADERKQLGAFYTPDAATSLMARWVMDHGPSTVLEPSFGDGAFFKAIECAARESGRSTALHGAELNPAAFRNARKHVELPIKAHRGDFLSRPPLRVDAVIGNPPFVRLRNLDPELAQSARTAAAAALGQSMDPAGSTWMPFVLHASESLNSGGCLAFVLPLEITHVKYARVLWSYLARSFGRIRIIRTHHRIFEDLLQDVVILLADERGGATDTVEFQVTKHLVRLDDERNTRSIAIADLVDGLRSFHYALLPKQSQRFALDGLSDRTVQVGDVARIRIGYVAGDKKYFHPDDETVERFKIPSHSLRASAGQARLLRGHGLNTSSLPKTATMNLWLPTEELTSGERRYVAFGVEQGVDLGYKCAIRRPWFVVPGVEVPDVIFSVFSDTPVALLNDANLVASNSLLCGYMDSDWTASQLVAAWFTSITRLFIELEIHSLGGGVLVAVPLELSKVRVPRIPKPPRSLLRSLNAALANDDPDAARAIGDQYLLDQGVVTKSELDRVRDAADIMRMWRVR
jgi:adenine-specific DNA-methyltransferase